MQPKHKKKIDENDNSRPRPTTNAKRDVRLQCLCTSSDGSDAASSTPGGFQGVWPSLSSWRSVSKLTVVFIFYSIPALLCLCWPPLHLVSFGFVLSTSLFVRFEEIPNVAASQRVRQNRLTIRQFDPQNALDRHLRSAFWGHNVRSPNRFTHNASVREQAWLGRSSTCRNMGTLLFPSLTGYDRLTNWPCVLEMRGGGAHAL